MAVGTWGLVVGCPGTNFPGTLAEGRSGAWREGTPFQKQQRPWTPALQPVPHTRAHPRLPATPGGPPAPPSCGHGTEPASGGPAGHLHTHVKLRLGKSPDTVGENRKREKRFVFERKVSVPLGLSLGLGSWEPRWVGPFLRPGHGEPGRVSSPSTRVCVPSAHPLTAGPAASFHVHRAAGPVPAVRSRPPAFGFGQGSRGL